MTDAFKQRVSDAVRRLNSNNEQVHKMRDAEMADAAAQQARVAKASRIMMDDIRLAFVRVTEDANAAIIDARQKVSAVSRDNGYSLSISTDAAEDGSRGEAPCATLFVDMDGNIITTYSKTIKFKVPSVMRPENFNTDVIEKIVGDVIEAIAA
ncbi:hypothetical protein [Bradyrhizobium sp. HKCCYLS3013]|uniref:hypothetical protein n=1 Tax=Bradyrhizobium sp. HKCCYLS3013 TaxID=3420735 RepID=UPI003EC1176B